MTQEAPNDDTSPKPVAANDIVADARQWLDDAGSLKRLQTHSGNCHQWHVSCLVVKLIREVELQRACTEAGREEIARLRLLAPPDGVDFIPWSVAASTSHASHHSTPLEERVASLERWKDGFYDF